MQLLKVEDVRKKDERGNGLQSISFEQKKWQRIAIAGETGCGKSTLLKIIAGLEQPDAGEVLFEGKRVKGPLEELIPGHKGIAYLSQQFELPNFLTVEQVLIYANTLLDADAEKDEHAKALYKTCRIDHLLKRKTDQLSGGEKQRVALTRLLLTKPKLLLLDEPFSNLDMVHKNLLKTVIKEVGEQLQLTCLLVSHDPLDTLSWADTILVIQDGQILQQGTPEQIYKQPENEYIAGLFGKYNLLTRDIVKALVGRVNYTERTENLFIRPEYLFVSKSRTDLSIDGKINEIYYYGSHYEIEVSVNGSLITSRTNTINYLKKGDKVFISI